MQDQVRTLVVDDEEPIRFTLSEILRRAGYAVTCANSGEEALERLRDTAFDLILLDLSLGGQVDGLRVLESARWRWPEAVIVILTAHGSLESARVAIREGVDDYLLKPVEPEVVRTAVRGAMERRQRLLRIREMAQAPRVLQRGTLTIDMEKHEASRDGQPLHLTPGEFSLLVYLVQNSHRVLSPRELVWVVQKYESEDRFEAQQMIKWYIHRLRRKVEPNPKKPRFILNVRGVGYRFGA